MPAKTPKAAKADPVKKADPAEEAKAEVPAAEPDDGLVAVRVKASGDEKTCTVHINGKAFRVPRGRGVRVTADVKEALAGANQLD